MTYLTGGTRRRRSDRLGGWVLLLGLVAFSAAVWVAVIAAALWAWGILP